MFWFYPNSVISLRFLKVLTITGWTFGASFFQRNHHHVRGQVDIDVSRQKRHVNDIAGRHSLIDKDTTMYNSELIPLKRQNSYLP